MGVKWFIFRAPLLRFWPLQLSIDFSKTVQLKQIHLSGNPVSRISVSGVPQVASFTNLSTNLEALFLEHV